MFSKYLKFLSEHFPSNSTWASAAASVGVAADGTGAEFLNIMHFKCTKTKSNRKALHIWVNNRIRKGTLLSLLTFMTQLLGLILISALSTLWLSNGK